MAKEYNIEGAVIIQQKFCDPHECDIPPLKWLLESNGIPCYFLEFDVTVPVGPLQVRMEAFLEQHEEARATVGRFTEIFATHPWLPKRVLALERFGESELFRRHTGNGEGGLSMERVDEQVHRIIRIVG